MVVKTISSLFFPVNCIVCGKAIDYKNAKLFHTVCENCFSEIPPAYSAEGTDKRCRICSRKLISEIGICSTCRKRNYLFDKNISLWDYQNYYIKKIIHSFKFKGKKNAAFFLSEMLSSIHKELFPGIPIVPAPCSSKRIKKYGWDHMKLISSILNKKYGISVFFIFRKLKTREQKELDFEQRQSELQNRIVLLDKNAEKCLEKSPVIILIDDVFTTGATANYCTSLMLRFGFKKIIILTLALD